MIPPNSDIHFNFESTSLEKRPNNHKLFCLLRCCVAALISQRWVDREGRGNGNAVRVMSVCGGHHVILMKNKIKKKKISE